MYTLQTYLAGPVKGKEGLKAYAIAGRHTLMVAGDHVKSVLLSLLNTIKPVLRRHTYDRARIGEYGACLLGTKDNQLSQEAAKHGMTFMDRV
jgi:hypothetical protein